MSQMHAQYATREINNGELNVRVTSYPLRDTENHWNVVELELRLELL